MKVNFNGTDQGTTKRIASIHIELFIRPVEKALEKGNEIVWRDRNPQSTFSPKQSGGKNLEISRKVDNTHR